MSEAISGPELRPSLLSRAAIWVAGRSVRGKAVLAIGAGALATGALPPFDLWPLLIVSLAVLIWVVAGSARTRDAFWLGWWFGLGHFATGLYWIANALLIDAARFWWMVPFAVLGLPALLGVFTGAVTAITRWSRLLGWRRVVLFAALWALAEFARGHVLTGFPWNLIAYSWDGVDAMRQTASWIGAYGVSLVTVVCLAMPAVLVDPEQPAPAARAPVLPLILALALLISCWVGGSVRLSQAKVELEPGIVLRLVQPNIPQTLKWDPAALNANLRHLVALSTSPSSGRIAAVIWPESATGVILERETVLRRELANILAPGTLLITGTPRMTVTDAGVRRLWNGMVVLTHDDQIVASFDKAHLVPFGEYVPLRDILPVGKIVAGLGDFSAGPGPRAVELPGLPPVGPMICYEGIFPGAVVNETDRPSWLLSLTNDGWFGYSTGPLQHFVQTGWRAVEEGLPLVRVANTGVSGLFDPYGRVLVRLDLEQAGILDIGLPQALIEIPLFARTGNLPWILVAGLIITAFLRPRFGNILLRKGV